MTDSAKLKFVRVLIKAFVACSIFFLKDHIVTKSLACKYKVKFSKNTSNIHGAHIDICQQGIIDICLQGIDPCEYGLMIILT